MSRRIKLWEDPYGNGELYKKKYMTFKPGLTVLVGCNGIGKTTLLNNIQTELKKKDIPYIMFDNLNDGGESARSRAGYHQDLAFLATAMQSSEGENIVMNIGVLASELREFISTGVKNDFSSRLAKIFRSDDCEEKHVTSNERWILLDAIDSGLSIDNICNIKEYLFKTIFTDPHNQDKDIYIIASANEYELANGENCLDVLNGNYIKFKDYNEYRELILKTREEKEKRHDV